MHPWSRTRCRVAAEGWLAHWLDFAAGRWLPPMPAPLEQPFWLDPGDPHRVPSPRSIREKRTTCRLPLTGNAPYKLPTGCADPQGALLHG